MEENTYKNHVFLDKLLDQPDYKSHRLWREHQAMQFAYVKRAGLGKSDHFLDVACGPLRLGAALIPYLSEGVYYGMDINAETIQAGLDKLDADGVDYSKSVFLANETFDFSDVTTPIDMAFSNSLFSHLTLNTIMLCLSSLSQILRPGIAYHSTFFELDEEANWQVPQARNKWGRAFQSYPNRDPFHYKPSMLAWVAAQTGFEFKLETDYGHPTQSMAVFTRHA